MDYRCLSSTERYKSKAKFIRNDYTVRALKGIYFLVIDLDNRVNTTVHILTRETPSEIDKSKTAYRIWHGKKPDLTHENFLLRCMHTCSIPKSISRSWIPGQRNTLRLAMMKIQPTADFIIQ